MPRRRARLVLAGIVAAALVAVVAPALYPRLTGAPLTSEIAEHALRENRLVAEQVGVPPAAVAQGAPQEETRRGKGRLTVSLVQRFAMPGTFAAVIAWYRERLDPQGWKPFDRSRWRENYADFCRPPWLLVLHRDGSFETERPPHHVFVLRIEYHKDLPDSRCPVPE